jgi:hypothetical protein
MDRFALAVRVGTGEKDGQGGSRRVALQLACTWACHPHSGMHGSDHDTSIQANNRSPPKLRECRPSASEGPEKPKGKPRAFCGSFGGNIPRVEDFSVGQIVHLVV